MSSIVGNYIIPPLVPDYKRPTDWLAMPSTIAGEQVIHILVAVFNIEANFVAFTIAGNYTVDWGDGTAPVNYSSGVKAEYNIAWSAISAGTLTTRGYRQALIKITPQGGANLTTVTLNSKHSSLPSVNGSSPYLHIRMAGSNITGTLAVSNNTGSTNAANLLEMFEFIGTNTLTSLTNCFIQAVSLRYVNNFHTNSVTNFSNCFINCYNLVIAPTFNTSAATSMFFMFNNCSNLQIVPLYNTANVTAINSMFAGCGSLKSVPQLNTIKATNFSTMFSGCSTLQSMPSLNYAAALTMNGMFINCFSLETIPPITAPLATTQATITVVALQSHLAM